MSNKLRRLEGNFEQEMQAGSGSTTRPTAEQRDIQKNFGGDALKASISKAVDAGEKPSTPVWLELSDEQWARYQAGIGTAREVARIGLVVSAGQRVFASDPNFVPKGTKNGKPLVRLETDQQLDTLVDAVLAHRATRPMTREDASRAMGNVQGTLDHLVEHNRNVDMLSFRARLEAARKAYLTATVGGDTPTDQLDFRQFVGEVEAIGREAEMVVEEHIAARNVRMGENVGLDVSAKVTAARIAGSARDRRNALLAIGKDLYEGGARDPQHPSQHRDEPRQGIGNRPDNSRRRDSYPGGRKRQNFSNRF
ncbi:MAG: hypothetical protein Q7S43_03685 [bacterium]|nr:hypothetical protein [bacterium]